MSREHVFGALVLALGAAACGAIDDGERTESEPDELEIDTSARGLIDCSERPDTGYTSGNAFTITVVTVDGKPVEVDTANAYYVMQQAAAADGVAISIVSGFRTMEQQEYLYGCYVNCNCNNCNLAARPGYSNHQSGHALDLNTSAGGVLDWLNARGAEFGFMRTVPSEPWHWEWWGGGPGGGPCGHCMPHCEGTELVDENCGRGDCGVFAAYCSTALGAPRCVSAFCVAAADEVPVAHEACLPDGQKYQCDAVGGLAPSPCPEGQGCVSEPEAHCRAPAPPVVPGEPIDVGTPDEMPPAPDEPAPVEMPPSMKEPARLSGVGGVKPVEGGCTCGTTDATTSRGFLVVLPFVFAAMTRRRRGRG